MLRTSIVLPTYNESENIRAILDSIFTDGIAPKKYSTDVVIVDDKSPDGTATIARSHAKKKGYKITVVSGDKAGLGEAYKRGFNYVIKKDMADIIIMMDADLSHDAKEIKHMVQQVVDGSDLVIGSRYVHGGKIPGDWPMLRIVNSRVARFVTRYIGGLSTEIEDPAGGFRAINVETLKSLDFDKSVSGSGYVFQAGTVNHFLNSNKKVTEHPIAFNDRQFGESKIRISDVLEYFAFCLNMKDTSPFKRDLAAFLKIVLAIVLFAFVTVVAGNNDLGKIVSRALGIQAGLALAIVAVPSIFGWLQKSDANEKSSLFEKITKTAKYTIALDVLLLIVALGITSFMTAVGISSITSFIVATLSALTAGFAFVKFSNARISKQSGALDLQRNSIK